ncbi:hypothetical protein [Lewinella sp. W8]|uniref:hypothetical protein n=1 Tax=Lewinella sp. W8 TaxID=2528208 RepID=UPI001067D5AE|nr:hypothetical protein [Lewinella sp. W8]MTB52522.1 hypothetical protein [Lewinella sp. W8]
MEPWMDWFRNASSYSVIIPFLLGWFTFRRHDWSQRMVFYLVALSLVTELVLVIYRLIIEQLEITGNNLPLLHLFTWAQTVLLLLAYRSVFREAGKLSWLKWILGGFTGLVIINALFIDGVFNFNTTVRTTQSVLMLSVIFYYFYQLLQKLQIDRLEREPLFWISAVLTIYFSGNFIVFLMTDVLKNDALTFWSVYSVHSILNIIVNLVYGVAFWVRSGKKLQANVG